MPSCKTALPVFKALSYIRNSWSLKCLKRYGIVSGDPVKSVLKVREKQLFGQVDQQCVVYRNDIRVSSEGVGLGLHRIYVVSVISLFQGMRM